MRLFKQLLIAGDAVVFSDEKLTLELGAAGVMTVTVSATAPPTGVVQLLLQNKKINDQPVPYFLGVIEYSSQVGTTSYLLRVRELLTVLDRPLPVLLRHTRIVDILAALTEATGIPFVLGKGDYSDRKIALFYSLDTGFSALDALEHCFGIEDFIFQQQEDGHVYVGSHADSVWSSRAVTLPRSLYHQQDAAGAAVLPVMPRMRPGVVINGERVQAVTLVDDEMMITVKS